MLPTEAAGSGIVGISLCAMLLPTASVALGGSGASFRFFLFTFLAVCCSGYLSGIGLPGGSGPLILRLCSNSMSLRRDGSFLSEGSCGLMKLMSA